MVNWICDHCGLSASDLPDGIDTDEFYEVMYGNEYCGGCITAYEEGIWMIEDDHYWGTDVEDDEGDDE